MKTFLLVLSILVLTTSAQALPPRPDPIQTSQGVVVFYPDRAGGPQIMAVTRAPDGHFSLFANEKNRYQMFTTECKALSGKIVRSTFIEVYTEGLKEGNSKEGLRYFIDFSRFPVLVFDDGNRTGDVKVYWNGSNGYLIVAQEALDASN